MKRNDLSTKAVAKTMSSILATILAIVMLVPTTALALDPASDTTQHISKLKGTVVFYQNSKSGGGLLLSYYYKPKQVTFAKTSNNRVLSVMADAAVDANIAFMGMSGHRPGRAKVTYTYKGKKRSATVVIKRYENPIASLKVGNKTIKGLFARDNNDDGDWKLFKGKSLRVIPAKNWKITDMTFDYSTRKGETSKKFRNGSVIPTVKADYRTISIALKNTKTGGYQEVRLWMSSEDSAYDFMW